MKNKTKFLPEPVYYRLRDLYASARDIWRYFSIRREYTNFSGVRNLAGCVRMILVPDKTILFYPDRPSPFHVIYKLCALSGTKISTNPNKNCDCIFWSHNSTFPEKEFIKSFLDNGKTVINSNCDNVSKKIVGRIFEEVFGYPLDLNPSTYSGLIVKKSIYNGTNFATLMEGPLAPDDIRDDFVYQKKIENRTDYEDRTLVYRVPVYGDDIPVVYLKFRPVERQFTGNYNRVEVKTPEDVFSGEELLKIVEMNQKMGIDYGECDVLRDVDGKIYVVDVNNNPGGPPRKMSHRQKVESAKVLIPSLQKLLTNFTGK